MAELLEPAIEVYHKGGFVMPFLLGALVVLWYALAWRALTLTRGDRRPLRAVLADVRAGRPLREGVLTRAAQEGAALVARQPSDLRGRLKDAAYAHRDEIARYGTLVRTLVTLAPLAGLLGTVTGMIETFDSLAEMALFTQGGGIAGGIGEALFSTQMGLAVAVPGLVVGRLLAAREHRLASELDELEELLCARELA